MMPSKLLKDFLHAAFLAAAVLLSIGAVHAQSPKPDEKKADAGKPLPSNPLADACFAPYGLTYAKKVQICSDAINSSQLKGVQLGLAYYNRAVAYGQQGEQDESIANYKEALRTFTDVIRVSQASAPLLFQRGLIYHTLGDADQAIVDYSDSIRIAPNETYAYVNRGIVLYTKKDNNEGAIADFNSALKLKPCEVSAWINRGLVYKRKGDLDQSIKDLTDALKCLGGNLTPVSATPPANPSPQYLQASQNASQAADAYYQRGLVYIDKASRERKQAGQMYDLAIRDFNDAIRLNPTMAAHFVGRASAYMLKEEFRQAIADFTEAIRLAPGDEYTYLHRGIAYHTVNEPDNAISDCSEAHRINPQDVNPLINRGIVYYSKKGLYDLAIQDFTEALDIDRKEINALINRGIPVTMPASAQLAAIIAA